MLQSLASASSPSSSSSSCVACGRRLLIDRKNEKTFVSCCLSVLRFVAVFVFRSGFVFSVAASSLCGLDVFANSVAFSSSNFALPVLASAPSLRSAFFRLSKQPSPSPPPSSDRVVADGLGGAPVRNSTSCCSFASMAASTRMSIFFSLPACSDLRCVSRCLLCSARKLQ